MRVLNGFLFTEDLALRYVFFNFGFMFIVCSDIPRFLLMQDIYIYQQVSDLSTFLLPTLGGRTQEEFKDELAYIWKSFIFLPNTKP